MPEDYMNEPCPKGGKHDWDLVGHSSGGISDWAGTLLECTKCNKKNGEFVNIKTGERKVFDK